jgi:hypothetical protein
MELVPLFTMIILLLLLLLMMMVVFVVVGCIEPFYFVRTMDSLGSVCFFVVVVGTCIVVNGCLDAIIVIIIDDVIKFGLVGDGVVLVPGMEQFDLIQGPIVSNFRINIGTNAVAADTMRITFIAVLFFKGIPIVVTNNVIIIIIISIVVVVDVDVVVVNGYCLIQIEPFFIYFVRTMDAMGSVCFFVIVVGTCIVVDGCLDSTLVIITDNVIIIIIIIIIGIFDVVVIVVVE